MPQGNIILAGEEYRPKQSEINTGLQAVASQHYGASAPAQPVADMLWLDTTDNQLKRRNAANTAWVGAGVPGAGAVNGATVSALELGSDVLHKTVLTLTATPLTLTDDAGLGQYGGVKIYDFPAGAIAILGSVIDADITLAAAFIETAAGQIALGEDLVAAGNGLAVGARNILGSTVIAALVARTGPCNAAGGAGTFDGTSTALDLNLNVKIDDDGTHVTSSGTITGTVTITWVNLGDSA